jgi:replicative DNA helicase
MSIAFYNHEAERAIIALLVGSAKYAQYVQQLSVEDFHDIDCKTLFHSVNSLTAAGKPVTVVTLLEELQRRGLDDSLLMKATEWKMLYSLEGYAIKAHIETVKSCRLRRDLYKVLEESQNLLTDGDNDTAAVLDSTRQRLRDLITTGREWSCIFDVLYATMEKLERRAKGEEKPMPSGVPGLDNLTSGFHKGELTIIGARPAVGKSALGMFVALSAAKHGHKVGVISLEMTDDQYGARVLGSSSEIGPGKLRSGDLDPADWAALGESLELHGNLPINFQFNVRNVEDLRMEVQKLVDSGDLDMLVIDYLQLLQTRQRFQKDFERIGYVSRCIKQMSTDYKIAIVALAQVGRSADGSMPSLSELRGSGEIEQDADNVLFLHRCEDDNDRYVHPSDVGYVQALQAKGMQYMIINVAKQRQGEIGMTPVVFNPARMHFTTIAREE